MSLRVVLYAEGAGEAAGEIGLLPAPTEPLADEHLGAAHVLVARSIERARRIPSKAIRFESPLRVDGRTARGSSLHTPQTLGRLLRWTDAERQPQLVVVLVDADGDATARRERIAEIVKRASPPTVLGVSVQEFEAWLLADARALGACGLTAPALGEMESLERRVAKSALSAALSDAFDSDRDRARQARISLARTLELDEVARRCRSFATFLADLAPRP
jgi:hypothetical protein